jgi:hypothetical protein
MTATATQPVTWEQLARTEPRLSKLRAEAMQVDGSGEEFCANRVWYHQFKQRLMPLVGWERAAHPLLGTERAYDVAYEAIYQALPVCRNCGCFG